MFLLFINVISYCRLDVTDSEAIRFTDYDDTNVRKDYDGKLDTSQARGESKGIVNA